MKRKKTTVSTKWEKVALRKRIAELRAKGMTLAEIGEIVNRNPATVSRHLQDIQAEMIEDVSSLPSKEMEEEDYEKEFKETFDRYSELKNDPETDPRDLDRARLALSQARHNLNAFKMEQELREQENEEASQEVEDHAQLKQMLQENRRKVTDRLAEVPPQAFYDHTMEFRTPEEKQKAIEAEGKARAEWLKEKKPSKEREGMTELADIIIRDYNNRAREGKRTAFEKAGSNRTQPRRKH